MSRYSRFEDARSSSTAICQLHSNVTSHSTSDNTETASPSQERCEESAPNQRHRENAPKASSSKVRANADKKSFKTEVGMRGLFMVYGMQLIGSAAAVWTGSTFWYWAAIVLCAVCIAAVLWAWVKAVRGAA